MLTLGREHDVMYESKPPLYRSLTYLPVVRIVVEAR
jgi:hypothetical protein